MPNPEKMPTASPFGSDCHHQSALDGLLHFTKGGLYLTETEQPKEERIIEMDVQRLRDFRAFCAAERTLERLPADTRRLERTALLISHFPFNHHDVVFRYTFKQGVG